MSSWIYLYVIYHVLMKVGVMSVVHGLPTQGSTSHIMQLLTTWMDK